MKVSIITVCKNSEKTIERTIQSVLSQTYSDIEYIIIDGNSDDRTKEIIHQYDNRIAQFTSEPDHGIYQAMNKGIRQATGEFLYFANSDDYLFDADVIQDLVNFVSHHPDCDLLYGDHEARFFAGDAAIYQPVGPEQMLEELICLGDQHLHQFTSFFKADLFNQIGPFSEAYKIASDYEWFLRALQNSSLNLYYYPRTISSYAHGGASGNIEALFAEVFDIQNKTALCQQELWLIKRLQKLQRSFIEKYDLLERTHKLSIARLHHIESVEAHVKSLEAKLAQLRSAPRLAQLEAEVETLRAQVSTLQSRISAMETSKFWKLRTAWFQLQRLMGIPTDRA